MFSSNRRNTNIFIGQLNFSTNEDTLRNYFEQFGYVKEVNIMKENSGKSRCFGFVLMSETEEARKAVVNARPIIDGRRVIVNLSCRKKNKKQPKLNIGSNELFYYDISFGNLTYPEEFVRTKTFESSSLSKMIINSVERNIEIILDMKQMKTSYNKFEISFDSIDLICIDENRNTYINFFLVLNRPPVVFNFDDDTLAAKLNILTGTDSQENWYRVAFNSNDYNWSLWLKFDLSLKSMVINELKSIKGIRTIYKHVTIRNLGYTIADLRNGFKFSDFESLYALECLISQCQDILIGKINHDFNNLLNSCLDSSMVCKCLEILTHRLNRERFSRLNNLIQKIINDYNQSFLKKSVNEIEKKNVNLAYIKRAIVTPTRIIYFFKQLNTSNRVIRKFGEDNYLRIRFRDDDLRKLNMRKDLYDLSDIYAYIKQLLINGITISKRKYEFLAMSSSQLRDHGCWLMFNDQNNINAATARKWMGDFKDIRCIGKYAARLGQCLSSSIETFETKNFQMIPDINIGSYCFTDGIGKITKEKALEISSKNYESREISAFQIRFGGFKGVVAIDPNVIGSSQLLLRKSMKKFESVYSKLDVLNISEYIPCYLNRQIIIILSTLGIHDDVFSDLQDEMLKKISQMLVDPNIASHYLNKYYRSFFSVSKNNELFNYCNDSFFRDLLKTIYRKELQDLIKKSRIFVPKGRILLGTIDETRILESNQVFIKCNINELDLAFLNNSNGSIKKSIDNKSYVVIGKIVVAKNPCMHPGDLRVMDAVYEPKLDHMIDCIVFPSRGTRPITNMCSGSDLDGDLYFVSWDPLLIPKKVHEPMDYEAASKTKIKQSDVEIEDVISFFVNFIEVDQLGRIANAHLALSDSSPLGVKDPKCIELAKLFSSAVDFPKTGETVSMPSYIKIDQYPDFMEKNIDKSYESQKIIGIMYRKCKKIVTNESYYSDPIEINQSLLIEGYNEFIEYANNLYQYYRTEMEIILKNSDCRQESELFVGISLSKYHTHDDDKQSFKLAIKYIRDLWDHIRQIINNDLNDKFKYDKNKDLLKIKLASAFYFVAYSSYENRYQKIISFAWILEDYLYKTNFVNRDTFSNNFINHFIHIKYQHKIMTRYMKKISLCEKLSKTTNDTKLIMIGLFGLILFQSDCEIEIMPLTNELSKCYNILDYTKKCFKEEKFDLIDFDEKKLMLFIYFRQILFKNPILWPILYTLMHFAKIDNLFFESNLKVDDFIQLSFTYFIRKKFVKNANISQVTEEYNKLNNSNEHLYRLKDWHITMDFLEDEINTVNKNIGKILLEFYKDNSFKDDTFQSLPNEFEPILNTLNYEAKFKLKSHCFKLLNILSNSLDIKNVWNQHFFARKYGSEKKSQPKMIQNKLINGKKKLSIEESSLFLFTYLHNHTDIIEFLNDNNSEFSHIIAKSASNNENFSSACYKEFFHHSLKQLNKAVENIQPQSKFQFRLKFGSLYLSNLKRESQLTFFELDDFLHNKDDSLKSNQIQTLFYSKINIKNLDTFFVFNDFKSKTSQEYIVYIESNQIASFENNALLRLKYDSNLQFVKIEHTLSNWLCINLKNIDNNKDIRFTFDSKHQLNVNSFQYEFDDVICLGENFIKSLKNGIIVAEKNVLKLKKEFLDNSVFVEHFNSRKYYGDYENNWSKIFEYCKIKVPEDLNTDLLSNVKIILNDLNEYSQFGDTFTIKKSRIELIVGLKIDLVDRSDYKDYINLMWYLSKVFDKIL